MGRLGMEKQARTTFEPQLWRGFPYFASLPQKLSSYKFETCRTWFAEIDRTMESLSTSDTRAQFVSEFAELESHLHTQPEVVSDCPLSLQDTERRLSIALQPFAAKQLRRLNAATLGCGDKSEFRKGPMWVGSQDPRYATYVAPPSGRLQEYILDLERFFRSATEEPTSLTASLMLAQLVLIHPFNDGNGRTARALFLGISARRFGFNTRLLRVLSLLWEHRGLRFHSATLSLRKSDSWVEYLSAINTAFRAALDSEAGWPAPP